MTYGSRAGAPSVMSHAHFILARRTLSTRWNRPRYRVAVQGVSPCEVER